MLASVACLESSCQNTNCNYQQGILHNDTDQLLSLIDFLSNHDRHALLLLLQLICNIGNNYVTTNFSITEL